MLDWSQMLASETFYFLKFRLVNHMLHLQRNFCTTDSELCWEYNTKFESESFVLHRSERKYFSLGLPTSSGYYHISWVFFQLSATDDILVYIHLSLHKYHRMLKENNIASSPVIQHKVNILYHSYNNSFTIWPQLFTFYVPNI